MVHLMNLYEKPFNSIRLGKKTIEIRLNDDRRRLISVGDIIEFEKLPDRLETIKVRVEELLPFASFEEMYREIPFHFFDCEGLSMENMLEGTYRIWSKEQETTWGALGIRINLI